MLLQVDMEGPCPKCVFPLDEDDSYKSTEVSSPLINAMRNGHKQCVNAWIESGADVNIVDSYSDTALTLASKFGHHHSVELLIKAGADVNYIDGYGNTALLLTSKSGHFKSVEMLIKAGADVNYRTRKRETTLIVASHYGHIESMEILIKAGADVNAKDKFGCTALFTWNQECVKVLLRADILINKVSHHGVNALGYVLIKWGYHSAELLFAAGEMLENVPEDKIPDCLKFEDSKLQLKHICREAIRKHLLELDPHQHLFGRIPKLESSKCT